MTSTQPPVPHEVCELMLKLRRAARLSLAQAEIKFGVKAMVVGSYERGDRHVTLERADKILAGYGYRLAAVPIDATPASTRLRTPEDMALVLRTIADQLAAGDSP